MEFVWSSDRDRFKSTSVVIFDLSIDHILGRTEELFPNTGLVLAELADACVDDASS